MCVCVCFHLRGCRCCSRSARVTFFGWRTPTTPCLSLPSVHTPPSHPLHSVLRTHAHTHTLTLNACLTMNDTHIHTHTRPPPPHTLTRPHARLPQVAAGTAAAPGRGGCLGGAAGARRAGRRGAPRPRGGGAGRGVGGGAAPRPPGEGGVAVGVVGLGEGLGGVGGGLWGRAAPPVTHASTHNAHDNA